MDEEKKETTTEENTTKNTDEGVQPKATSLIDDAHSAAKRLEEANKKQEELLNRQEQIMAKQRLGGRSEINKIEKPAPLSDKEYAEKFRRGEIPLDEVLPK